MPARIPDEELLEELRRLRDELNRPPSANDVREHGKHSRSVYTHRFESWEEARCRAGVEPKISPSERKKASRDELLQDIRKLADELQKAPSASDMEEQGPRSPSTYQRRFGSWETARIEAGFPDPNVYKIQSHELLSEIRNLAEEVGRRPNQSEMDELGKYTSSLYHMRFGGWDAAVQKAGFEGYETPAGSDSPLWKGGTFPYGEGWTPKKRRNVRERDGFSCVDCGMNQEEHLEEFGAKLCVHHIQPAREVDDPEFRNSMQNLVTVCKQCHQKWEGIPLRPQSD